ncbi:hypothetical protein BDZ97DRAFT_1821273 [Flammula alnicola]|nr:hypothetical protein BDZ97DRAFT_1821273 [Flammula alnicola]
MTINSRLQTFFSISHLMRRRCVPVILRNFFKACCNEALDECAAPLRDETRTSTSRSPFSFKSSSNSKPSTISMRPFILQSFVVLSVAALGTLGQSLSSRSSDIVLLSLTKWTEQHITALVNANTNADLEAAVDSFISKNVVIELNGANITRDAFTKSLEANLANRVSANVTYNASVEVPTNPQSPVTAGWVGIFFVTTSTYGNPNAHLTIETASDNLLIQQDPSIPPPPNTTLPIRGDFDGRRIMVIQRVSTEVTTPLQ